MKSNYNVGPGYVYAISKKPIFANSMFLGHITGLAYWLVMEFCKSSDYFNHFHFNFHRCQSCVPMLRHPFLFPFRAPQT